MEFFKNKNHIFLFACSAIFLCAIIFVTTAKYQYVTRAISSKEYIRDTIALSDTHATQPLPAQEPQKPLENPPEIIRAVYVTGWSAGSKNYLAYLQNLFATTKINSVVIDLKDYSGMVSYKTAAAKVKEYGAYYPVIGDINGLVNNLHRQGIYVIGRLVVFEDSALAKHRPDLAIYDTSKTQDVLHPVLWQDHSKLSWMDPAAEEVWDYNIDIAKDAISRGFDEINFDYIRFPSDGQIAAMGFPVWDKKTPRNIIIKNFFQKLRDALPDAKLSVDIFGQTTTNTDDMGIGQIFEDALSYFDYVSPMVYPSHYAHGFLGHKNPAEYPYQIVAYAINGAVARQKVYAKVNGALKIPGIDTAAKVAAIRPWLQDFDLGAIYDKDMVIKEIQAVMDAAKEDFKGFMLWNSSNIYTKEALAKEAVVPK